MEERARNGIVDLTKPAATAAECFIEADFTRPLGAIRPLHGINNSPLRYNGVLPELREAGIPFVRLHDTGGAYGGTYLVDVPNLFRDFSADPKDPASYDFAFTDAYLSTLVASGMEIFYRFGTTIENNYAVRAYRINPPDDPQKWATVCEMILRHYNEGWANGFHYNIRYAEIWNEPENPPMWTGGREDYFRLYAITAKHLKSCFPDLRVGGYAGCGFYALNRPDQSDFFKSFVPYFDEFLKMAVRENAPLDFYSWHLYTCDPEEIVLHARFVREKLLEYGFDHCENIFDEWNRIDGSDRCWTHQKTMPGAVFCAAAFCVMQRAGIDKAMYYDALPSRCYCGLYDGDGKLTRTYFAFRAFNTLYRAGTEIAGSSSQDKGIFSCSAVDANGRGYLLVVNCNDAPKNIELRCKGMRSVERCLLLDDVHTLTETAIPLEDCAGFLRLPSLALAVLELES